ncbi:MAG: LysR family glycine cleavage system transcriptional activator [Gammaproteobacteria bacterium]|jgi:LysR family glycine cleavage system transcriptional activator
MPLHDPRIPSSTALRAFEAAARHLSFTRAAAELNQIQGAVSHQIRELEQRLDTQLFRRGVRGISLTQGGRTYLPFVNEALARLRAGAAALARRGADNVLTVSMSPNFAAKWLVPRLGDFANAHPTADLRISAALDHVTFDDDGIDLAIRYGEGDWPDLHVSRLCAEVIFPVCSPQLASRVGAIHAPSHIVALPLLHDREHARWRQWLRAFGVEIDDAQLISGPLFNQSSLAIDAAVAGQGVALARSALVAIDLAAARLVRPLAEQCPAPFAYWIVCPNEFADAAKIVHFIRWLTVEVEKDTKHLAHG